MNAAFVMMSLFSVQDSLWRRFEFIQTFVRLASGSLVKFISNGFEQIRIGVMNEQPQPETAPSTKRGNRDLVCISVILLMLFSGGCWIQ